MLRHRCHRQLIVETVGHYGEVTSKTTIQPLHSNLNDLKKYSGKLVSNLSLFKS